MDTESLEEDSDHDLNTGTRETIPNQIVKHDSIVES